MKSARPFLAAAFAGCLLVSGPAQAAAAPVTWTDAAGDGNGLNGQGIIIGGAANGGNATPVQFAGRDILSVKLANTFKKVGKRLTCTGFTATMNLAGPAEANSHYRVQGVSGINTLWYILEYDTATQKTQVRFGTDSTKDDNTEPLAVPAKLGAKSVTFTITMADLKMTNEKAGSVFTELESTVSASAKGLVYLPLIDLAPAPEEKTFKVCK